MEYLPSRICPLQFQLQVEVGPHHDFSPTLSHTPVGAGSFACSALMDMLPHVPEQHREYVPSHWRCLVIVTLVCKRHWPVLLSCGLPSSRSTLPAEFTWRFSPTLCHRLWVELSPNSRGNHIFLTTMTGQRRAADPSGTQFCKSWDLGGS